jgi:hypothetical protein
VTEHGARGVEQCGLETMPAEQPLHAGPDGGIVIDDKDGLT